MSPPAQCENAWETSHHFLQENDFEISKKETETAVQVTLMESQLWNQFKTHTNEMTLTKLGRRLFPVFKIAVSGLEANCMYNISLEFVQVDSHRWRYVNGEWVVGIESHQLRSRSETTYTHPDSPNFGAHWMNGTVSFGALKLSNKPGRNGQVVLNSLHKYQPRVHITKVEIPAPIKCFTKSFIFPETQFITVTAYQNEEIITLKIKHNQYAKGPTKRRALLMMQSSHSNMADYDYPNTSTSPQMSQYIYSPPSTQFNSNFYHGNEKIEEYQKRFAPYFQPDFEWQSANFGHSINAIPNNQPDLFHQYQYPPASYSNPFDDYQTMNSHQVHNGDFDLPQPSDDWSHFDTFPHFS